MMKHPWLFVTSLIGLAVSAAIVILLIPSLFRSGQYINDWLVGGLVILTAFAVATRYWRHP